MNSSMKDRSMRDSILDLFQSTLNSDHNLTISSGGQPSIQNLLHNCKQGGSSGSIIVLGWNNSAKKYLIQSSISSFQSSLNSSETTRVEIPIASVNGSLCDSNEIALCALANQLTSRSITNKDFDNALKDLEACFKKSKIKNIPTVIILEDIHRFASSRYKTKQLLIYALVDLLHRPDLFFVLIGTTSNVYINQVFEKRVSSRLNAQYVILGALTQTQVCSQLKEFLSINSKYINLFSSADNGNAFISRWNKIIQESIFSHDIVEAIQNYVDWGCPIEFFIDICKQGLLQLMSIVMTSEDLQVNDNKIFFSSYLFLQCLRYQCFPSLIERLSALPLIQLHLIVSITRLFLTTKRNDNNSNVEFSGSSQLSVREVFNEFFKLTKSSTSSSKQISYEILICSLISLAKQSGLLILSNTQSSRRNNIQKLTCDEKDINENTLVRLIPSPSQVQDAFRLPGAELKQVINDSKLHIIVSERIRRSVLQPHLSLTN